MGILYNRFTPEPPPFLIPYSNRSDIVTYLTPDNFQGISSTLWGDDYPKPMVRDDSSTTHPTTWNLNSDNSVRLSCPGYVLANQFTIPMNADSIRTFTVYMVAKYNADNTTTSFPRLGLINGLSNNIYIYWGEEDKVKARLYKVDGTYYTSTLTPSGSAFDTYHVYAFRRQDGHFCHVIDDGNLVSISVTNVSPASTYTFGFMSNADVSADVKFLSIVKGSESDTTILNNVQNIMVALNIH